MARDTLNYDKENAPKTAYSHMSGHGWGFVALCQIADV